MGTGKLFHEGLMSAGMWSGDAETIKKGYFYSFFMIFALFLTVFRFFAEFHGTIEGNRGIRESQEREIETWNSPKNITRNYWGCRIRGK